MIGKDSFSTVTNHFFLPLFVLGSCILNGPSLSSRKWTPGLKTVSLLLLRFNVPSIRYFVYQEPKKKCMYNPSIHQNWAIFSKIAYKENASKVLFHDINSVLQRPSFHISVSRFDSFFLRRVRVKCAGGLLSELRRLMAKTFLANVELERVTTTKIFLTRFFSLWFYGKGNMNIVGWKNYYCGHLWS